MNGGDKTPLFARLWAVCYNKIAKKGEKSVNYEIISFAEIYIIRVF